MRFTKQALVLASVLLFVGSTSGIRTAAAEEAATAKPAVTETKKEAPTADAKAEKKSEHCAKCHEKHTADCGKSCPDCKKGTSCAKCDHCKGEKDCSKCKKCHEGKDEKAAKNGAKKAAVALLHAAK